MKIGVIGPSDFEGIDKGLVTKLAKIVASKGHEIVIVPHKGSVSEFFAQEYLSKGGKKVYSIIPLDDKEFGYDWVNTEIGEQISCGVWRNQPEKLNEESDVLLSIAHAVGGMIEIGYSKWFKKKPVYIITDIDNDRFPKRIEKKLDLKYVSIDEFEKLI